MNLRAYQEQFLRAVQFDRAPATLSAAVRGGGTLTPDAAVDVYRRMYWYRLVDAHFALLPRTAAVLGAKRFTREVCACLAERPSRVPVLERLATPFADFLATRDVPPIARDLARLEARAMESLISGHRRARLFTRGDATSPGLAAARLQPEISLRACVVSAAAVALYRELPGDVTADEDARPLGAGAATATEEVGAAFTRPRTSVELHVIEAHEVSLLGPCSAGELLLSLATPPGAEGSPEARALDPARAFARFATFIDGSFFTHPEDT